MTQQFYRIGDLLGKDDLSLQKEYISGVRDYQSAKKAVFAGDEPAYSYHSPMGGKIQHGVSASLNDAQTMTFNEIYHSIKNPEIEIASAEEVKRMTVLESKLKADTEELKDLPNYLEVVTNVKKEVVNALLERAEMLDFMEHMAN